MDNSLDRNHLWSPPIARAPQQYHLQTQSDFLLSASLGTHSAPHPGTPSSTAPPTRRSHHPASQIQLEEQPYPRTHIPFPQHQRYLPDATQLQQTHVPVQRRSFQVPPAVARREDTPGPSHTSAEEEPDEYPNGTSGDADSNGSESHEREGRLAPEGDDDIPIDEEPLYVNAKQYNRILKRRVARARLEELHRLSRQRKPYLHESRHKHAMRRPRGPGGRFLTAEEIAAQQKAAESSDPSVFTPNPNPSAEERKAMKAAEPTASGVDGAQKNGPSFGSMSTASGNEAGAGPNPEFRAFENTAISSNTTTNAIRETPGSFSAAGRQQMSSSGPQVQFSDLSATSSSGTGMQ